MSAEFSPEFDREHAELGRQLETFALLVNLRAARTFAERLQSLRTEALAEQGLTSARHFVFKDAQSRFVPLWTERITLASEKNQPVDGVRRLLIRFPSPDNDLPLATPNDTFLKIEYADNSFEHYLLNGTGMWEYRSVGDLDRNADFAATDDLYCVSGGHLAGSGLVRVVNHLAGAFVPIDQLASETGPE